MAETTTPNYGWTMPDPGASANTWGATLNATTQKIDAQVYTNQQAGVPVGSGAVWFTNTPPTNWLICDGSSLSTTTYAKLFAVIGYAWGGSGANFNLPPLPGKFPFGVGAGVGLAAQGGASSITLTGDQLASHAHSITDVAHTHGASQPAHTHGDYGHGHVDAGSYQDAHTHGGVVTGLSGPGTGAIAGGVGGGNLIMGRTDNQQPALHIGISAGYANLAVADPAITVAASGTNLSTTNTAGSGNPIPTMPPFIGVNFIIKFQ